VCLLAFVAHFPLHVTLVLVGASLHATITLLPFAAATFLGVVITASFHPAVTFLPCTVATFLHVVIIVSFCIVQRAKWAKKNRGSILILVTFKTLGQFDIFPFNPYPLFE
jgi:hypothetical protein